MAYWLDEDTVAAAERALGAALRMREELAAMNASHPVLVDDPIEIRIGLNTGEIILCDIGAAEARIDLTTIGDSVNVAARLESACKQYGIDNLISSFTLEPLRSRFASRLIDRVRVKGKQEPIECYELLGESDAVEPDVAELVRLFDRGMSAYLEGSFEEALRYFEASEPLEANQGVLVVNPSRVYQARCRELMQDPRAPWDGVWELSMK